VIHVILPYPLPRISMVKYMYKANITVKIKETVSTPDTMLLRMSPKSSRTTFKRQKKEKERKGGPSQTVSSYIFSVQQLNQEIMAVGRFSFQYQIGYLHLLT
jgi:hypothetical protein